jgi:hypothetical protein
MTRTRTRDNSVAAGSTDSCLGSGFPVNHTDYGSCKTKRDQCIDSLGRNSDHPLTIIHDDCTSCEPVDGTRIGTGGFFRSYNQKIPGSFQISSNPHLSLSLNSVAADATTLIARTNPSRPVISIFNFIYEMKDLPEMIKMIGEFKLGLRAISSARDFANHQLSLQMGWAPLFSDLRKIVSFQDSVDKRVNELERLYSNGGLRRRVSHGLSADTKESSSTVVFFETSNGDILSAKKQQITHAERWGTIRWVPTTRPALVNNSKVMRQYARSLVFGFGGANGGLRAKYLWDAIPWTWMIDWFVNVGDYMQAYDNTVPCEHSVPNIMTRTTSKITYSRTDSFSMYSGGNGTVHYTTLERAQSGASLSASLPFINGRQLSILGALAVQRLRWFR